MMFWIFIGFIGLLSAESTVREKPDTGDWIEILLNNIPDDIDEDQLNELVSRLEIFAAYPVSVHELTETHLVEFMILDEFEIKSVLEWVRKPPKGTQTSDLFQNEVSLSPDILEFLDFFIVFDNEITDQPGIERQKWYRPGRDLSAILDYSMKDLHPTPAGYGPNGYYLGSSTALKENYMLQNSRYRAVLARNKIAGEAHQYPIKNGQATYSIHFNELNFRNINSSSRIQFSGLYLGDFKIRFGLGTIASSGTMRIDSRSVRTLNSGLETIRQNGSSASGKFMRGAGVSLRAKNLAGSLFISRRKLTSSMADSLYYLPGWNNHIRTSNDLEKHKNIALSTLGGTARIEDSFRGIRYTLGILALYHHFNHEIIRRHGLSYEQDFKGKNGFESAITGHIIHGNVRYAFETAQTKNGFGFIHSLSGSRNLINLGLWQRYYSTGFKPFLGNGPSAFSGTGNEKGIGFWVRFRPSGKITFNSWGDQFQSLDLRFSSIAPISGNEIGFQSILRISRYSRIDVTYRARSRMNNHIVQDPFGRETDERINHKSNSTKLQFRTDVSRNLLSVLRLEYNRQSRIESFSRGLGLSQMVRFQHKNQMIYMQHTIFKTNDHDSRVYFYEYDMINALSMPAYSGLGQRSYVMLHLELLSRIIFRFKIARTMYSDRYEIGTGNDSTAGNARYHYSMQVRINL